MGTGSLSREARSREVALPPTPSSAEVKERVKLYLYSLPIWAFMAFSGAKFTYFTYFHTPFQNQKVDGGSVTAISKIRSSLSCYI
jgi:hypothetical protein